MEKGMPQAMTGAVRAPRGSIPRMPIKPRQGLGTSGLLEARGKGWRDPLAEVLFGWLPALTVLVLIWSGWYLATVNPGR